MKTIRVKDDKHTLCLLLAVLDDENDLDWGLIKLINELNNCIVLTVDQAIEYAMILLEILNEDEEEHELSN